MQPHEDAEWTNDALNPRRSTRVQTDVFIELQGDGFVYAGETLTVSLHGALVRTSAPLEVGMPVTVYVYRTGEAAAAHVVYAARNCRSHYGIELDSPQNIWGIVAIPEDWNANATRPI
jgi:hypothetical protein